MEGQIGMPGVEQVAAKKSRVTRVKRYINDDKLLIISRRESDEGDFIPAAEIDLISLSPEVMTKGFEHGIMSKVMEITRGRDYEDILSIIIKFANSVEDGNWPESRVQNTFKFTRDELDARLGVMSPEEAQNTIVALRKGLGIDI